MGTEPGVDEFRERLHHAGHVLHAVPAGDLNDEWRGGVRDDAVTGQLDVFDGEPGRKRPDAVRGKQTARREHGPDDVAWQFLVLRRERVDRGRHDGEPVGIDPVRRELSAREDERVGMFEIGSKEIPGAIGPDRASVEPDVAAPDDPVHALLEERDQSGRLRIVEEEHVTAAEATGNRLGVLAERVVVGCPLRLAQLATVARPTVQPVVDALRDREERRVAPDHEPASVDAHPPGVAEQRGEHLCDPAAHRRRVDVDDGPSIQNAPGSRDRRQQPVDPPAADDRLETNRIDRGEFDLDRDDHAQTVAQTIPSVESGHTPMVQPAAESEPARAFPRFRS